MDLTLLIKGLILGIAVSAPLGPMGMIVVQRNLNSGQKHGFLSGIGVAASDTSYAIIAAFSLSMIIGFIVEHQTIFTLIGASVLLLLGIKLMLTDPLKSKRKALRKKSDGNSLAIIGQMYLMTLTNPASLFIFGAAFASFGIIQHKTPSISIILLLVGILIGTLVWWFLLNKILSLLNKKIRLRHLFWINEVVGLLIIIIGLIAVISIFI